MLACGISCFDPLLPALDYTLLGFLLPVRAFAHSDSSPPVLDLLHLGPSSSMHSFGCSGFVLPLFSMTCFESLVLALDRVHSGLSPLLRSIGQPEPAVSLFGISCMGSSPLVLDCTLLESSLFSRCRRPTWFQLVTVLCLKNGFLLACAGLHAFRSPLVSTIIGTHGVTGFCFQSVLLWLHDAGV